MKSHCCCQSQGLAITLLVCTTLFSPIAAHGWETVRFAQSPTVIEPAVTYVSQAPAIDGVLDAELTCPH